MSQYSLRFISNEYILRNEIFFDNKDKAEQKLEEYINDKSGDFRYIALFNNPKATVEKMLHFENGKFRAKFGDWDIVGLREGFYEAGEKENVYCITNMDEIHGQCLIVAINDNLAIGSAETVGIDMVNFIAKRPVNMPIAAN